MKIIYDANGQLCNRFWSYVETIAEAIEKNEKVYIWQWDTNIKYYDKLRNSSHLVSFPFYSPEKFAKNGEVSCKERIAKWLSNPFVSKILGSRMCKSIGFVSGWSRRCEAHYYPSKRNQISDLFIPNDTIVNEVQRTIAPYKKKENIVVGVHVRRGDYRDFIGGRFYFSDNEYSEIMDRIVEMYPDKTIYFFVASNEKVPHFSRFNYVITEGSFTAAHDLYGLSICDFIIGPISTFSRWASFVGDVPLCFLDRNHMEEPLYFRKLQDYSHWEDGTQIISMTQINNEYTGWKPVHFNLFHYLNRILRR